MNTTLLRKKKIVLPAIAAVAVLAVGGTIWAASADDVTGGERDRVAAAAISVVGGGEAVDVESSDDPGEAYEVEVRLEDGTEVDVTLDENLDVVTTDRDDRNDSDDRDDRDDRDEVDDRDADDRILSDAERTAAEKAALTEVAGTVVDVDASDDRGVAYEVEVRDAAGLEWDIELDADFAVVGKYADR